MDAVFQMVFWNSLSATAIAALVALATRFVRQPSIAYGLWALVLLRLIAPPLLSIPVFMPMVSGTPAEVSESPAEDSVAPLAVPSLPDSRRPEPREVAKAAVAPAPELRRVETVQTATTIAVAEPKVRPSIFVYVWYVWALGSAGWFLLAVSRVVCFHRCLRCAEPAPAALIEAAHRIAAKFGLRSCPEVLLVRSRIPPLLWTIGRRPRIVLPAELLASLSPSQQTVLVAHELAHFWRRDHWVRCLEFLVLGLYWWHPVAWWARRGLSEAEEGCCDAWVLWALPGKAKEYARTILATIDFLSPSRPPLPLLASGLGQVSLLKRRCEMILQKGVSRCMPWPARLVVVLVGLVLLAYSPWAHRGAAQAGESARGSEEPATNTVGPAKPSASDAGLSRDQMAQFDGALTQILQKEVELAKAKQNLREVIEKLDGKAGRPSSAGPGAAARSEESERTQLALTQWDRLVATQRELKAVRDAYRSGSATIDLYLDAQRRACEADNEYSRALADLADVSKLGDSARRYSNLWYACRRLDLCVAARDEALTVWREAEARQEAPPADAKKGLAQEEAQARQQYFLLKAAAEQAESLRAKIEGGK